MTYRDALAYLDALTNYERLHHPRAMREVRLERMQLLCERLGNPQRRFRSILVAGTNGKGSICAMIYEILRAANLPVGLYTSPHLEDLRERIRVSAGDGSSSPADTDWIREEEFAAIVQRLRPAIEHVRRDSAHGSPTYFEALTAAAFLQFVQRGVDLAVLEVGLGGRLDATNVVDQAVSVLGPIGLDHTDILGTDLLSIAKEKAGIIKPKSNVISATQAPEVLALFRAVASEQGCPVYEYGQQLCSDIVSHGPQGMRLIIHGARGRYDDLSLPLVGRHQAENATLAVTAVELLSDAGIPHSAVRTGLAQLHWPGRLEVIRTSPLVVLDGAHNPHAACVLRQALEELWPDRPKHLVIGMSADKPIQAVVEVLAPLASSVTCTASRHPRACDPYRVAEVLTPYTQDLTVIPDAVDAYTYCLNMSEPDDLIVITGSLFLVAELRAALRRPHATASARRARRAKPLGETAPSGSLTTP